MWWLSPISWLLVSLLLVGVGLFVGRRRKRVLIGGIALAAVSILAMTPLVANFLLRVLERTATTPEHCRHAMPDLAVVMAGGVDGMPASAAEFSKLTLASRRRAEQAAGWWREEPHRKLLISGGTLFEGAAPESQVMAAYLVNFGVPVAMIEVEDQSTTTWEGAQRLAAMRPPIPHSVTLITSAAHMRRAAYAMEQAGFEVCRLPTDSRIVAFGLPGYLIPQHSAVQKTEAAMHEFVGLAYYWWLAKRGTRITVQ